MNFTIATYNILNPFHAVKWQTAEGLNKTGKAGSAHELRKSISEKNFEQFSNWNERKELVVGNISGVDIVLLQEVAPGTLEELQQLSRYEIAISALRTIPSTEEKYGNAILYDSSKAKIKETLEIKFQSQGRYRSAATAVIEFEGFTIKAVCLHLDGYNSAETDFDKKQKSKESGFKELQFYLSTIEENLDGIDVLVVGGDLNEDHSESDYALYRIGAFAEKGYLEDGARAATEPEKNRKIDWLFVKNLRNDGSLSLESMQLESASSQASDHLMSGTRVRELQA